MGTDASIECACFDFPASMKCCSCLAALTGVHAEGCKMHGMKTLDERIQEYADRKRGGDWKAAHDFLIEFALATIEARRKGGEAAGNRPQQEKQLARARKARAK